MAVKPQPPAQVMSEDEFINEGRHLSAESKQEKQEIQKEKWVTISLRLPELLVRGIDQKRKRASWVSRNEWIRQAIVKSLEWDERIY